MALLRFSSLLLSGALQVALPALATEPPISMDIEPAQISVNVLYSGATVHVQGMIPAGYDAAIICSGEEESVELKRKGRVFGFLWMNVGDVVVENVPSLYLLSTTRPLPELAPAPVLERLGVGYAALESGAVSSHRQEPAIEYFREFLKLKESEDLYSFDEGGAKLEPGPNGAIRVSAECALPRKTPWGEYQVRLIGFEAGRGELLRTESLRVVPVGAIARIASLAQNHGLLYGILAVVIALGVGLLTGLAFGLGSKKGH